MLFPLNIFTSCDVAQCGHNIRLPHSDDLFSQSKTKSSILCLPAGKETSFTSSEEPAEETGLGFFQGLWLAWFSFYKIKKECNFECKPEE